jgi:hypothetical protein
MSGPALHTSPGAPNNSRKTTVIAALIAVLLAIGIGGALGLRTKSDDNGQTAPSTVPTDITSPSTPSASLQLSDAAVVFCNQNLETVLHAAESLGLPPVAVVDEADPRFRNADSSRRLDDLQAAWRKANAARNVQPHYIEPSGDLAQVRLVTDSPWKWYRNDDFSRACEAAFGSR